MHAHFETPGCVADWARERGHQLTVNGPPPNKLPHVQDFDYLIVLGGPQSPLRMDLYPYLRDEITTIAGALERGKAILGICLGAQLIAEALGAATLRSPEKEVGVLPVSLTDAGREDPKLAGLPPTFDALHWHHDMPGIPPGAELLAYSEGCPHQAVRFADRVYGLQFHLEATAASAALLACHATGDLSASRFTQSADQIVTSDFKTMNARLKVFLDSLA